MNGDDDVMRLLALGRDREAAQRGVALVGGPTPPMDGGRMDPLAQFELLGPPLGAVFAGLRTTHLEEPTPCAAFTVRGVLEHMIGGATAFAAAYRGEVPPEPTLSEPIVAVQTALADLAAAVGAPGALDRTIQAPFGEIDGGSFARFVVLDGLVHGWDLATATGQAYEPPDALVAAARDFAEHTLEPLRDGETFKNAVEPGPDATPIERLAAFTGRTI